LKDWELDGLLVIGNCGEGPSEMLANSPRITDEIRKYAGLALPYKNVSQPVKSHVQGKQSHFF
jgi:hypothetical protein